MKDWLKKFAGTIWKGKGELWLDSAGNSATLYDCKLEIKNNSIDYSWFYNNDTKQGCFVFNKTGANWSDSFHQQSLVQCFNSLESWGIFTISCEYEVPNNPNWGWRIKLSQRPDDSLVLQMTNIAPWGEEGRAVRMVFYCEQT